MRSNLALGLIFALTLGLALPMAYAKESDAETTEEVTAPAEEAAPMEAPAEEAPAVEAPAAEAPAVEAGAVIEGAITAVDLKSENPSLTVKAADGTESTVFIDLDLSLVLKGDEEMALEDLAAGQKVKITQADFDGKLVVDTVEIV